MHGFLYVKENARAKSFLYGVAEYAAIARSGGIWASERCCGDGKRLVLHADEKLTAFLELESVIHACGLESELGKPLKETEQAEAAARKRFLNSYQA